MMSQLAISAKTVNYVSVLPYYVVYYVQFTQSHSCVGDGVAAAMQPA